MEKNKRYERGIKLFFAILCVIILVPIILLVAFDSFINNTDLVIGITGFAQKVAFRSVLSLVALIIAIVCLIKCFDAGFPISLKMDGRCQRGILTTD